MAAVPSQVLAACAPALVFPSIEDQIEQLRTPNVSPITIVDDVIFAGDGAVDLARRLETVNRPVETHCSWHWHYCRRQED